LTATEHFFERDKDLEHGKWVKVTGWVGRAEAAIAKAVKAMRSLLCRVSRAGSAVKNGERSDGGWCRIALFAAQARWRWPLWPNTGLADTWFFHFHS
jgi:hypothetical protein